MDPYLPADLPYVVDRNPRASLLVGLMSILKVEQSFLRSRSMIIIYMAASIIGGTATAALVGQHGLLLGLLAAPLGGSLSALLRTSSAANTGADKEASHGQTR